LVDAGASPDVRDRFQFTPFLQGAVKGKTDVLKLLWEKSSDSSQTNSDGSNALMLATQYGHVSAVKFFLEKGMDVNARNKMGQTAFQIASSKGHRDIMEILKK